MKTSVGGSWAQRQMRELQKLGFEVHVALPDQGPMKEIYQANGIQTHFLQTDFPLNGPWLLTDRLKKLKRLVDKIDPDIIHSHFVGTTLTMRLALRNVHRIPRLFQVPGPLHLEQSLFRKAEIATAQDNDYWISTCSATRKWYLNAGIDKHRVFPSYYGIDPEFLLQRKTLGKLRYELGLDEHTPLVGMVSYIYKPKYIIGKRRGIKGHEDLIDAVAFASKQIPNLKAVFIGGSWEGAEKYEFRIRQYAKQKIPGRAFFLGSRNDVPELYADIDIAVHPSHSENLGGAGESLLMGIPTIATNIGGFPDIVIPDKTGYLVPDKAPMALARAIVYVFEHYEEALQLARNGSNLVKTRLDVRRTTSNVACVYQHIANK